MPVSEDTTNLGKLKFSNLKKFAMNHYTNQNIYISKKKQLQK